MKIENKTGIAPLIATVMLIVIVIAAAAIVWTVVIPFIRDQMSSGTACLNTVGMEIDFQWTCWDETGEPDEFLQVKVVRDSKDFELVSLIFKATDSEGNSATNKTSESLPGALEDRIYTFTLADLVGLTDVPVSIAVAPVVNVEGKEQTCDFVSSVPVETCTP